ncbi:PREDICTED: auxin response factor 16-like [Tarenaya hassleriana]|uniref:auxin response factor 16-like n=1 Tax=Tarenaya hassleriana TaxID=28532 RepID=UPI00053C5BD7|nr:PREDICTED: auxin response factor 16-like [Tarenaya hassleriana]XP_010554546.1 PREDICTED: auxin response factor 16-like [Tarenaya hassleriana]
MINVMNSLKDPIKGSGEKCLDPQLWHACAGGMVRMPHTNSKVAYFPQGHAENAYDRVDFGTLPIPAMVLCRVLAIKYMADAESDEVFAKIRLMPLKGDGFDHEDCNGDGGYGNVFEGNNEKTPSFAKTLTQSDANNGGGFSVPRYCAETIFPRLDYNAEPPVQTILAKDVHGDVWKFRHIYRGTPRRHLLTTGWSNFVNQKKLVAGDSIVFMRAENGDLCVGIRRAKRGGIGNGPEYSSGWNPIGGSCVYASLLREDEGSNLKRSCSPFDIKGKVTSESVLQAATLAISGKPFDVVYYPRASTSEFCVKLSEVRAAMQIPWCSGMRFKMAFETEDSSRISWFMGTVSSVSVSDPVRWPDSPWRLLQVAWDEPDLLQNVKRVNPWLVELVSNIPSIPFSSYSPSRKKMRFPQNPDYSPINSISIPSFSSNHLGLGNPLGLGCVPDNVPVGLQGARHAQYELSSSDLHHLNRLPPGFFPICFQGLDRSVPSLGFLRHGNPLRNAENDEKGSCFLTMGSPKHILDEDTESKKPHIVLFGKLILPEQPKPENESADTNTNLEKSPISSGGSSQNSGGREKSLSEEGSPCKDNDDVGGLETGHCKVFMESDNVGRTLDISVLGSYEELNKKLSDMFGIENPEILSSVLYCDASGAIKYAGNEPFSHFSKTARRLTILTDQGSENVVR